MYEPDPGRPVEPTRALRVRGLHHSRGMRPRSSTACRLPIALAVLGASLGGARFATAKPPAWEPGCSPIPLACTAGKGQLKLDLARRKLAWKWTVRGLVGIANVENPTITDRYDFCLYDGSNALVLALGAPAGGSCSGRPCWRARPWGFEYRDRGGANGGLTKIVLKAAAGRRDRFLLQAAGPALPMPAGMPSTPIVVQLVRTHLYTMMPAACWTSTYPPS